ncbi:MAG TPA: hypothetical protein PLP48_04080 [Acholeplasmataceae bacterium]|nr:hypothetical protein [Acholeplasmataceae bacterium]
MKQKMVIFHQEGHVIYEGKALNIPIKMDAIRQQSIELFHDADPCIIHQSYAIQKLIQPLVDYMEKNRPYLIGDLPFDCTFIDLPQIESCTIMKKG